MKRKLLLNLVAILACFSFIISAKAQNALNFDGVNDYISSTYPGITGNNARTIEAWIRTTANCNPSAGGSQKVIVDWGSTGTGARSTFNVLFGNAIRFEVAGNGVNGTIPVNDGLWHHVAMTYDPLATLKVALYVDGVLDIASNLTVAVNTGTTTTVQVGRRQDNVNFWDGDIDEVRIWDVVRTQAELVASMNSQLCDLPSSLKLYYPLNQGTAFGTNPGLNSAIDHSQTQINGTLNGFALTSAISNWVTGAALTPGFIQNTASVTSCGSYTWPSNGITYSTSGSRTTVSINPTGCDSVLTLNLTIAAPVINLISASACNSYTWAQTGQTYTTSGFKDDTLVGSNSCDSIVRLVLTINSNDTVNITESACGSYAWAASGITYYTSGAHSVTLQNLNGCDSIVNLNLTIDSIYSISETVTACQSYTWPVNGQTYTTTGVQNALFQSVGGCDSSFTLDLTINTLDLNVTPGTGGSLSADQAGATYQWLDCSNGNTPISGATNQVYTPTANGGYSCIITFNNCSDTSICYTIANFGLNETLFANLTISPNPSHGIFNIDGLPINSTIRVEDALGRVITTFKNNNVGNQKIDLNEEASGVYYITVLTDGAKEQYMIVKN